MGRGGEKKCVQPKYLRKIVLLHENMVISVIPRLTKLFISDTDYLFPALGFSGKQSIDHNYNFLPYIKRTRYTDQ